MRLHRLATLLVAACMLAAPAEGGAVPAQTGAQDVLRDLIDVPGAAEAHTPAPLNRGVAFRYSVPSTQAPSSVLIFVPGLNSGPNTADILARTLVASQGPALQVWVVAVRSTLIQDRRGVDAALAYRHPDFALGYYYGTLEIDGHTFHRLKGPEVPYMAYWGLDVHLRDIRAIVREVHSRYPAARVVLGGHSLGGILAAAYAGYDFAQIPGASRAVPPPPADVGGGDLDGLLFLDGLPVRIPLRVTPDRYLHGFGVPILGHIPGVEALTNPDPKKREAPFTQTSKLARTEDSILLDVVSVYALLRPEAASYFPFFPRRGLKITNDALAAAIFSDQMQPDALVRAGVELPLGVFDRVSDPAYVNRRGLLDLQSGQPAPGEPLIRLPRDPDPRPRVPIRTLLEAILQPGGDFTVWYFPWRLVLDVALVAAIDPHDQFARRYASLTHIGDTRLPMLIVGAGHGLVRSSGATEYYRQLVATPPGQVTVKIFPDYSHLDIEDADPNPVVPMILAWLRTVVH
ncbi:MAG TPA: hypothetical protein VEW91_08310 [bacterium]|nr:hypothetical protein [bacterium]